MERSKIKERLRALSSIYLVRLSIGKERDLLSSYGTLSEGVMTDPPQQKNTGKKKRGLYYPKIPINAGGGGNG